MKRMMVVAALAAATVVGCSQQNDPPSVDQTVEDAEFFTMPRPDGSSMACVQYGAKGGNGKSWYSFTCDWSGEYTP